MHGEPGSHIQQFCCFLVAFLLFLLTILTEAFLSLPTPQRPAQVLVQGTGLALAEKLARRWHL